MSNQEAKTFQGYIQVLPRQPEKKEDCAKVALIADDGTEYPILHKGVGMDLTQHVNAHAQVVGVLCPFGEGNALTVRQFTVTDGFEDEWYDDPDK